MQSKKSLLLATGLTVLLALPAMQALARSQPKTVGSAQAFAVINGNPLKVAGPKNYTAGILKPDGLKWCVTNIGKVNATDVSVRAEKARVESDGRKLSAESADLTRMGNELKVQGEALSAKSKQIEQSRATVDKSKKSSVDAFNAGLASFKEQNSAYDAKVKEYTSRGTKLKEQTETYKQRQAAVNARLDALGKMGADFAQRCSNKNYYEDDMTAAKGR